jgi:hypothetical protein
VGGDRVQDCEKDPIASKAQLQNFDLLTLICWSSNAHIQRHGFKGSCIRFVSYAMGLGYH